MFPRTAKKAFPVTPLVSAATTSRFTMHQGTDIDVRLTKVTSFGKGPSRVYLGEGSMCEVYLLSNGKHVVKSVAIPDDILAYEAQSTEIVTYERLGNHPGIIGFHNLSLEHGGIVLDYAKYLGILQFYREFHLPPVNQRFKWITQVANAVSWVHQNGVVHYDITYANVLLTSTFDAKLADFAGASIDGSSPLAWAFPPFYPCRTEEDPINLQDDIFGFGSLVYTVILGVEPYDDLSHEELYELYSGTPKLPPIPECVDPRLGRILLNCWNFAYESMDLVVMDLNRISAEFAENPLLGHSPDYHSFEPCVKAEWDRHLGNRRTRKSDPVLSDW